MPARFTNLRPAEAQPIGLLREKHSRLYAEGQASTFRDSIATAGLPAGIALAAARIAHPDFVARADYATKGILDQTSVPVGGAAIDAVSFGDAAFVALARRLARTDYQALAGEVRRGELSPDLTALIAATSGQTPSDSTAVPDDLLALYLVPGAFSDYRWILGWMVKLARLIGDSGQGLAQLLPSPGAIVDDLHGPWPDNELPFGWIRLLNRILFPSQIAYLRPVATSADGKSGGGHAAATGALAKSGLSAADIRQIASIGADTGTSASTSAATDATTNHAAPKSAKAERRD